MASDANLICFKAISNFVSELSSLFAKKQRSLKLYSRLIKKTTIMHDQSIQKHIDAFNAFCVENRGSLMARKISGMKNTVVKYSSRVYIDFKEIFKLADRETQNVIWNHLLTISALVDPAGKAKEVLKETASKQNCGDESEFLTNIIDKVEKNVDPNANPMEAVSSIMQSGIFTDLMSGMSSGLQNGNLDLGKLMGAVQGMVSTLGDQVGDDPQAGNAMNMLNSMMGTMGKVGEAVGSEAGGDATPGAEMTDIMGGMMQGLMNSAPKQETTVEEVQDEKTDNVEKVD